MRLDVLGDWPELLVALSAIAAVLSLVRDVIAHRQEGGRLRPMIGWFLATLGFMAAAAALGSLFTQHRALLSPGGIVLGAIALGGVLFGCSGAAIALRTPLADWRTLGAIAAGAHARVTANDAEWSLTSKGISLDVTKGGPRSLRISLVELLKRPPSKLVVVCGPAGSGKTVALHNIVTTICDDALRSRRPRRLALYVDLDAITLPDKSIDESMIKEHLKTSLPESADRLARYVDQPGDRPRWLFVFDLGGHLSNVQTEQYIRAVQNFMIDREDHAVIATRHVPSEQPSFAMTPLSARQQRLLLKAGGLAARMGSAVLRRLRYDPKLADIANSPLLLNQLAKSLLVAPELIGTRHEIVEAITVARISPQLISRSTRLAFEIVDEPQTPVLVNATTDALVEVGLGQRGHHGFRFRHPVIQSHLAGLHIRGPEFTHQIAVLLDEEKWRAATIAALQGGPSRFREELLKVVASYVEDAIRDMGPLALDADMLAEKTHMNLPMPGSFIWPRATLDLLTLLSDGLAYDEGTSVAETILGVDQLVVTAVTAGAGIDREHGIDLLPLASRPVASKLGEYVFEANKFGQLSQRIVYPLAIRADVYTAMKNISQVAATLAAFRSRSISRVLYTPEAGEQSPRALQARIRSILTICQVSALGLIVLMIVGAFEQPSDRATVVLRMAVVAAAVLFLADSGAPSQLGLTSFGYASGMILGVTYGFALLAGIAAAIKSIFQIVTLDISNAWRTSS